MFLWSVMPPVGQPHAVEQLCRPAATFAARDAEQLPEEVVLIGNINPTKTMALGNTEEVRKEVHELLQVMRRYPNFILSTGCDLPQDTPIENIKVFMETGRGYELGSSN